MEDIQMKAKRSLSTFDKHQLNIAYKTLTYSDTAVLILGGMTKTEAREIIYRLTGRVAKES